MSDLDIDDDFDTFDFKRNDLWLVHQGKNATVDFSNTTFQNSRSETQLIGCLIRQVSDRTVGSVRQVFERGRSIANDSIPIADTIIEVPVSVNSITPAEGDTIQERSATGVVTRKWMVEASDSATNNTRIRVACRSLK